MSAAPVVMLMGPTGAGKTRVALELAASGPFEIVSVDSAMVYRGLDIGTAKPDSATRARVAHWLIDICDPDECYSAARFRADATAAVGAIVARGHIPLLVGGTGLYFRALTQGLAPMPQADPALRARLQAELDTFGSAALHGRLAAVDPVAAARIHPNDPQRIQRALEVYELTGKPLSDWHRQAPAVLERYRTIRIVLSPTDRPRLHALLAARFRQMLDAGLLAEVSALHARRELSRTAPALRSVGYRQLLAYLDGTCDLNRAVEQAIVATRQLAKRQLTWLRSEPDCLWLDSLRPDIDAQVRACLRAAQFHW